VVASIANGDEFYRVLRDRLVKKWSSVVEIEVMFFFEVAAVTDGPQLLGLFPVTNERRDLRCRRREPGDSQVNLFTACVDPRFDAPNTMASPPPPNDPSAKQENSDAGPNNGGDAARFLQG
jgi:hypothetical protein